MKQFKRKQKPLFNLSGLIFLLLSISILSPTGLAAQTIASNQDSTKDEIKYPKASNFHQFVLDEIYPDTFLLRNMDTTFSKFFNYDNNLYRFNSNLGNLGTPIQSLLVNDSMITGLNFQFDEMESFRWGINTLKFKEVSQPYASVMYFNGAQKEEGVELQLSQNVRENWNISVGYRKIGSEGFFVRQRTAINNFYFNQHFKTKNNRYQLILYGIYNETNNEENGGLVNDTLFTSSPEKFSRKGFPVNFTNASNQSRSQEYLLKQRFNFGPEKKFFYINENDSIFPDSIIRTQIIPRFTLEHHFNYRHQEFVFEDKLLDSNNYTLTNIQNGSNIFDKTLLNKFDNEVGIIVRPWISNDSSFLSGFRLRAAAGLQYGTYEQTSNGVLLTDEFLNNTYVSSRLYNLPFAKHHVSLFGKLVVNGYNEGDFQLRGNFTNRLNNQLKVNLTAGMSSQRPALLFDQFASKGWSWNTSLNKIALSKINAELQMDSSYFKMGLAFQSVSNYTYFGFDGTPRQYSGIINTVRPYVEKLFNVSKFHLRISGGYQFSDQAGVINRPEIYTHNSLYLETRLFKSEMLLRIGGDLFYISEHTADYYNAPTRQFINQTQQNVGDYPWFEPFIMVNVERFYFFARMANATEGIPNYNYLTRPGYPMQDRAFKFAIKWTLIN